MARLGPPPSQPHLVAAARAHNEAAAWVNPGWADWYAERLPDDVNPILESEMTVADLSEWLVEADKRYRAQEQSMSWPNAYAAWLLEGRTQRHLCAV